MDVCDISGACEELRQFTEALTNWYVRRSRSRFWEEDRDAIDTLHTVLEVTARLAAPLLPLTTEVIWRGLTGERSVHLTDWPRRARCRRSGPGRRDGPGARSRLGGVVAAQGEEAAGAPAAAETDCRRGEPARLAPFTDLIADELNVKAVELTDDIDAYGRFELTVNARAAGPRLGKAVQDAIKAVKAGEGVVNPDGTLTAGRRPAARGVQLETRGRRPRVHGGTTGRRGPGGARRHRHAGARSRRLGQGPHPRASGPAQVHRSRRVGPNQRRDVGACRTRRVGEDPRRPHRRGDPCHEFRVRRRAAGDGTRTIGDGVRVGDSPTALAAAGPRRAAPRLVPVLACFEPLDRPRSDANSLTSAGLSRHERQASALASAVVAHAGCCTSTWTRSSRPSSS